MLENKSTSTLEEQQSQVYGYGVV